MSYGYGDWNSGSSRGYEGYGYGYGYGHEGSGGFGFGAAAANSWDLGGSEPDGAPEGGDGPGKQRQEPGAGSQAEAEGPPGRGYGAPTERAGSQAEAEGPPGRGYGAPTERYDPYESYGDSRVNDRDLYRAGFDYPGDYPGDYPNDYPGDYPNDYPNDYPGDYPNDYPDYPNDYPNDYPDYPDYPNDYPGDFPNESEPDAAGEFYGRPAPPRREQQFPGKFRENLGARGWGRERPFPARGGWAEPRGPARRLPSLFAHNILPEPGAFPAFRGFPGAFRGLKRMRRGWKLWDAEFRRKRPRREAPGRRRQQPSEERAPRTDGSDNSSSDNEEGTEGESGEKEESRGEGEDEEGRDSEKGALGNPEENSQISQLRQKLQPGRKSQDRQKKRHRDRMVERIQFVCSLCKFRTFFEDEIRQHLESKFHREHFQFVGTKLPQQTAQFLQEYVANKTRKTEERRRGIRDINAVIQQIQREQDLTQEVGLEHFLRKVEAAHCSACDLLIPMHFGSIQKHLKSLDHNHNRRAMLEQSKRSSLAVARSILNNKVIGRKLRSFLQGENPFTDDPEEKEEHEEGEGAGEENPEGNPENPTENPTENPKNVENPTENPAENPPNPEENPENPTENPQNPEENPENLRENPPNPTENPMENPTENPEENPTENPKNPEESPTENLENPTENPEENPTENPQNPEEKPPNLEENPRISADPEENPEAMEIPEGTGGRERAAGTEAGLEKEENSQNPQEFPQLRPQGPSGTFQE
ncbi:A-kinase anchor protein 8-like [Vidua chalybeata]|uniref:A-kinase anchor protein 8-like n=1 Tax=Vidua chalybeata TaxID=81927 RepID=UPI0023A7E36B|nr:A-kinase anchor protein 8-like [Vidua chalybeata]